METVPVEDLSRKYIDEALRYLTLYQSKQTKFLYKEPPYQAVSFYENLLFSLLLLRKKQHQEMLEGKALIWKLLRFQSHDSFPADLSDYPLCNDKNLPVRIAYILEILVRDFGHILGAELSAQVAFVQEGLRPHLKQQTWPKIEAFYAELLTLHPSPTFPPDELITNPASFGHILAALDYFPDYPWKKELLEKAHLFWDEDSAMYCGPGCGVFHAGKEQVCSLFDCWMSLHTGIPLKRGWTRESFAELALTQPGSMQEVPKRPLFESKNYSLFSLPQGTFAATFQKVKPHLLPGFSPLRFVSGGISLAWKFPHGSLLSFTQQGNRFKGRVERTDTDPVLFELYVERNHKVQFSVEGTAATLFNPPQGFEVRLGKAVLKVYLEPVAADLVGLVRMGNRPSQLFEKQAEEEPFDWLVTCERIRGEEIGQFSFCVEVE